VEFVVTVEALIVDPGAGRAPSRPVGVTETFGCTAPAFVPMNSRM
jgi:hypothetical protein